MKIGKARNVNEEKKEKYKSEEKTERKER
jgi:hypothetical protein